MVAVFYSPDVCSLSCVHPAPPGKIPTLLDYFCKCAIFFLHAHKVKVVWKEHGIVSRDG